MVAPPGSEGANLVRLISEASTAWTCQQVVPSELQHNSDAIGSAAAIVVATDAPLSLPPNIPVIACGPSLPPSLKPVSWVPRPSSGVLRALLYETLGPASRTPIPPPAATPNTTTSDVPPSSQQGTPSMVWRRKSDMIIGRSAAIRGLLDTLDRFASSAAAVSITGESGTGKELVARALHYSGPRARAPFLALNCAAIPEALFEAELFGYVRGAFTGAVATRTGAFEGAHGGTLFLDEVGEMPVALQPKLLRVLERGEITRLGSNESKKVAVRVVSATNRRLEDEVRSGTFRQDLFYRLRVCHVHIPPLRERMEDIAPLVAHHLSIIAGRERRPTTPRLSAAALEKLLGYRWPGNVRELVNVLEAAVLMAHGDVIEADHLQLDVMAATSSAEQEPPLLSYREAKARFEADYYTRLLRVARGNISLASKLAQKTRKEIYDALRRAGLDAGSYRDDDFS